MGIVLHVSCADNDAARVLGHAHQLVRRRARRVPLGRAPIARIQRREPGHFRVRTEFTRIDAVAVELVPNFPILDVRTGGPVRVLAERCWTVHPSGDGGDPASPDQVVAGAISVEMVFIAWSRRSVAGAAIGIVRVVWIVVNAGVSLLIGILVCPLGVLEG